MCGMLAVLGARLGVVWRRIEVRLSGRRVRGIREKLRKLEEENRRLRARLRRLRNEASPN